MTHPLASATAPSRTRSILFALTALSLAPAASSALAACSDDKKENPEPECTPGEEDCTCATGNECLDGLVCEANKCVPEQVVTPDCGDAKNCMAISLTGGDARACDLLVATTGRKVDEVVYPTGFKGAMRTRDLQTAIAVIVDGDVALTGTVAKVMFEGDAAVAAGEASVSKTTCYDKTGAAASGVTATIH